jgi:hypothetical protein
VTTSTLEKNRTFCTSTTTLQTKPKQMFTSSVLIMWPTRASEKNTIVFGPQQPPCKLNQNKSVSWHKKPPMIKKLFEVCKIINNGPHNHHHHYIVSSVLWITCSNFIIFGVFSQFFHLKVCTWQLGRLSSLL